MPAVRAIANPRPMQQPFTAMWCEWSATQFLIGLYDPPFAVQADGEVLGASCATIEMAGARRVSCYPAE